MAFTDGGEHESVKAAFHGGAVVLATIMGLYNALAFAKRRESHLAVNCAVYTAFIAWECKNVLSHCRRV